MINLLAEEKLKANIIATNWGLVPSGYSYVTHVCYAHPTDCL